MSAAGLFDALGVIPALPGARCRGRHYIFDPPAPHAHPDDVAYAEAAALRLCARCPALASCGRWFTSLPARKRPPGVVAGRVNVVRPDIGRDESGVHAR